MISFGKYDQKVSFISFGQTSDGAGGYIPSETVSLTTFASVKQLSAGDSIEASQLELPETLEVRIQYRNGFRPTQAMQVLYRSNYYKITGVTLLNQRKVYEYVLTAIGV